MDWLSALRSLWTDFSTPPEWAVNDCSQFASRYVQLRSGVDHAAKFTYHDKTSALRLLAKHDGLVGLITSCIGSPVERRPIAGDLVVCDMGESGMTTGIFNGELVIGIHPEMGIVQILPSRISHVWDPCRR